jgi:DNA-binding MarR family transcriptional regulator
MTVWNPSQLLAEGPAQLLERPLSDFADLLRQPEELEREHADTLDYVLRHTVVRLLVRAAGQDELLSAYEELRALVPVRREEELAAWLPRWRTLADVLDARLAVLRNRDMSIPAKLLHADRIVALVASESGLTQVEIADRLDLKAANLSRILGILEAHELIERRNVGREKRVFLGRLATEAESAAPAEPPTRPEPRYRAVSTRGVERGAFYMFQPADAA